jgi:hypothetical protein
VSELGDAFIAPTTCATALACPIDRTIDLIGPAHWGSIVLHYEGDL